MFPLLTKTFPANAVALRDALEKGLRRVVTPAGPMVTVEDKSYPELAAIRVSLDGATVRDSPPRASPASEMTEPGLTVEHFEIAGKAVNLQQALVNLSCTAREVRLGQGRERNGDLLLLLQDAAEGRIEIAIARGELETLLLAKAKLAAAAQGVVVEDVQIDLEAPTARAVEMLLRVRAKKLFLSATLRISGRAEIDEELKARLSKLECVGEGKLSTLACGFLSPYLQRLNGREFSLLALSLGEVKLRDVQISAGDELRISAEFGRLA